MVCTKMPPHLWYNKQHNKLHIIPIAHYKILHIPCGKNTMKPLHNLCSLKLTDNTIMRNVNTHLKMLSQHLACKNLNKLQLGQKKV